ncbi:hypothetical protein MTR67_014319 [Solanum verrucosum]|uniref:RNA polymerase sigma-70 region 2 domain-containing protein n=1 Tax=Solanum verrucosum TaxID=315347 RepID=A0AAF0TJ67_SOLVR|nr:hypothetical protein MTR67_014319 [Solanum verrucosum]
MFVLYGFGDKIGIGKYSVDWPLAGREDQTTCDGLGLLEIPHDGYSRSYWTECRKRTLYVLPSIILILMKSYLVAVIVVCPAISDDEDDDSVEVPLLMQKSMLEKQWNLSSEETLTASPQHEKNSVKDVSLCFYETMENFRLKERLECETSDYQLALSTLIECSLARERFSMSSVRLVMSIAQRYDNMGDEMTDLVRGGLIGLLHGIEKFDPSERIQNPNLCLLVDSPDGGGSDC